VGTASAEKLLNKRIVLQLAKMKEPLAAKDPADKEIKQDAISWKKRIVCLDAGQLV